MLFFFIHYVKWLKLFIKVCQVVNFCCIFDTHCFLDLCSLVYTVFVPASLASRCLTYETISILEFFDLVLHLTDQVHLQVVIGKGFELFF